MKNKFIRLFASFATLLSLFSLLGCHCDKTKLVNTWVLEKYGPESAMITVIPAPQPEILLTMDNANHFSGNDGCNTIFGSYKSEGHCKIQFDSLKTTLIFCQGSGVMQQAQTITTLLEKVNTFKVTDTHLELCAPSKEVLQYRKK
jgi:heat shock protein HslJ